MVKFLENKVIYNNFEKMFYEHYENESKYRNVYIVDIFPKKIYSSKYFDFEDYIINNKYNVLDKFVLAMIKIYMYDEDIFSYKESEVEEHDEYIYIKKHQEYIEYINKYEKSLDEFSSDVLNSLKLDSEKLVLYFNNLKVGFIIGEGYITYTNFGKNKDFIDNIFISEGLFIRS